MELKWWVLTSCFAVLLKGFTYFCLQMRWVIYLKLILVPQIKKADYTLSTKFTFLSRQEESKRICCEKQIFQKNLEYAYSKVSYADNQSILEQRSFKTNELHWSHAHFYRKRYSLFSLLVLFYCFSHKVFHKENNTDDQTASFYKCLWH